MFNESDLQEARNRGDYSQIEQIRSSNPDIRMAYDSYGRQISCGSSSSSVWNGFPSPNGGFTTSSPTSARSYTVGSSDGVGSAIAGLLVLISLVIGFTTSYENGIAFAIGAAGLLLVLYAAALVIGLCWWVLKEIFSHIGTIISCGVIGFIIYKLANH